MYRHAVREVKPGNSSATGKTSRSPSFFVNPSKNSPRSDLPITLYDIKKPFIAKNLAHCVWNKIEMSRRKQAKLQAIVQNYPTEPRPKSP